MSWSGGTANCEWNRASGLEVIGRISQQRAHALYLEHDRESFYCESCHGHHPLCEHRLCRAGITVPVSRETRPAG